MMSKLHTLRQRRHFHQQQKQYRLAQGRLTAAEAAEMLAGNYAIPLCTVQPPKREPVTLGMRDQPWGGHLLIVAPSDGRWADQLLCALAQWHGAALVVDPGGKLHARTAHFRQRLFGPVYTLPGYRLDLGRYYRFWNEMQARKLHGYLMPPYPLEDQPLLERSVALFAAVGHYAYARKRNLMHVLLDVAACDLLRVLKGLETVPLAQLHVRQFSKGQTPHDAIHDPEVVQAFNLFVRQLQRYQDCYDTFATTPADEVLPHYWVKQQGTLYLTYDEIQLAEMGGLVTAVTAGLVRYHLSHGDYRRLLLVLDVATAAQMAHFPRMLQLVGSYGITVILLTPSWAALRAVAGEGRRQELCSYFANQLWYPPHDEETAQKMSWLLGQQLCWGTTDKEPAAPPETILAWSTEELLVMLRRQRSFRFLAQPLTMPLSLHFYRSPPLAPTATPSPRYALDSLPALPGPQPPQIPEILTPVSTPPKALEDKKPPSRRKRQGWK